MSASNYNWVCFDCRFVIRQPKVSTRIPRCPDCGSNCYCLGYKVEIPKKGMHVAGKRFAQKVANVTWHWLKERL